MDKVRDLLLKALDLRKGDLRRTLMMQAYLFIIISVLLFLKPVSNSLFLSEFGIGQLPYVFIAVAIAAFIFTKLYVRLQKQFTFIKLHRFILAGIILSLILFFVGIGYPSYAGIFIYCFYIWVSIFALVATSQFWILANILFNPREARRVFGIIGAGGIAGGVFGGYITSIIVPYIGNNGLILLSAIFMASCFPLVAILWKENKISVTTDSLVVKKRRKLSQRFSFRRLSKSRHLMLLSLLTGIAVLVSKLVDFQFQGIAAAEFQDSEKLTSFFGFWFSTFNVVGLVIQLFLTSRLLKILGVSKTQFILPGSFVLSGILLFFFPGLWSAILLKGADGTFKQSIQRSVNELLMLPIPSEIKEQSKTFIDVFVDSFATGISGLILIFILSRSVITSTYVSIIIVVLSFVWIGLAIIMKKEYFLTFKKQFLRNKPFAADQINTKNTMYKNLNNLLEADNEEELLETLGNLEKLPKGLDYSKTLSLLGHTNPEVRYQALKLRPFPNRKFKPKIIELLINDSQLKIRVESYLFLLERNSNISELEIKTALSNINQMGDPSLLIAACIFFRDNYDLIEELGLVAKLNTLAQHFLIDHVDAADEDLQFHILKAIAFGRFSEMYHYLDLYLASEVEEHRKLALEACSFTLTKKYATHLILAMQDEKYAKIAFNSLRFYGETLLIVGDDILNGKSLKNNAKAKFISIFAELGTQNAANYLSDLLNHKSFKVRKESLSQLSLMKSKYPSLDFKKDKIFYRIKKEVKQIRQILSYYFTLQVYFQSGPELHQVALLRKKKKVLKRINLIIKKRFVAIFLLLGLEYDKKDIFDIYSGLMSKNELKRSYSLEFMEMFIDYKYGKYLSPLLEAVILKNPTLEAVKDLGIRRTIPHKALHKLVRYPDKKLQLAILDLFEFEEMSEFSSILNAPFKTRNILVEQRIKKMKEEMSKHNGSIKVS